jgi:hypothetical protein
MAKGANGTIDPASFVQLVNQRQVISNRNLTNNIDKPLGVSSNRMVELFPESPLLAENRTISTEGRRDPDNLQNESGDIYEMYANAIDPEIDVAFTGFGFEGFPHPDDELSNVAYMNYRHPNNPFIEEDEINYNSLTSGEIYDNNKAYRGFPDLDISSANLSEPSLGQDESPSSDITIENKRDDNFGNTTQQYRASINSLQPATLGRHATSNGNGDNDTLGTYFRSNMLEVE